MTQRGDVGPRHVRSAGEGKAGGDTRTTTTTTAAGGGGARGGERAGDGGVDSGASDQTDGGGAGRSFSIPPPVPLAGVAAPRGRPLIGLPGSKTSVTAQTTPLGYPMGVPVRNVSHEKIAVDARALKVRMRLAAHDEGLRRVAPECVTAMAHAVCAYVQRVAGAAVAARDARIAEARGGGLGGKVGRGAIRTLATLADPGRATATGAPTATWRLWRRGCWAPTSPDVRAGDGFQPTVRIEDLLAAMRGDPDPAATAHLERVGLSLAEENAREAALGGFGGAFD